MNKIKLFFHSFLIVFFLAFISCNNESVTQIKTFDGNPLHFDNLGKNAPTILLVHGWSNTRQIWEAQLVEFSKKYHVIAVDLPGFGESGNERNEWTIENFGKDIANLAEQLDIDQLVLVGFSLGGPIVIEAANQIPDQVVGVVLVDNLQDVEMQIPPQMAAYMDSFMMDIVSFPSKEKLVGGGFFKHNIEASNQKVMEMLEGVSHIGWEETLNGYTDWINTSCSQSIKKVKAPIIAINSDMKPTNTEAFRKYSPGFQAKIIKDVGHVIMWDNTEEFNRLLEESIQEFMQR